MTTTPGSLAASEARQAAAPLCPLRWLLVLLLSLFLTETRGQVGQYRSEFAVGVNGGYTLSSIAFVPKVPQTMIGSPTFGLTARYTSEKYFSSICAITAEVNVARIGFKEDILDRYDQPIKLLTDTTQTLSFSRKMTYIQVPVMARMGWGRERSGLQFFFQLGPQFGMYLGDTADGNVDVRKPEFDPGAGSTFPAEYKYSDRRISHVVAQDTMAVENRFDYGITGGFGLEYSHRKLGHFLIEGRYYYGLGNIYGSTKRDYFARSNHSTFIIKFTYLFDIIRTRNPKIK
ncbi:MAG: PorT family protein [Prevotella sp.]|nr:PorT family protein [Prevotella sp.]